MSDNTEVNKDGFIPGQSVTFDQIAKANMERSKRVKKEAETKAKAKATPVKTTPAKTKTK